MAKNDKKHLPRDANIVKMMPVDSVSIRFLYTAISLGESALKEIYCDSCIQRIKDCLLINLEEFQIAEAGLLINAPSTGTKQ